MREKKENTERQSDRAEIEKKRNKDCGWEERPIDRQTGRQSSRERRNEGDRMKERERENRETQTDRDGHR